MKIFSGTSNRALAVEIAKELNLNLSELDIHTFPDGEKRIRVIDDVLGVDCIVVQPTCTPVDQNYMELFFIIDSLKRSGAKSITAVVPYMGYQRQDHIFRAGEAVSLSVIAETLQSTGVTNIIGLDFHTIRTPELYKVPVIHLSALSIFAQKIKEILGDNKDAVLVTPDMGGIRRIKMLSEMLDNMSYVVVEKNRDLENGKISATSVDGEVKSNVFIVDDMIATGNTIAQACNLLKEKGASNFYVFATHAVFSKEAKDILQNSIANKIYVTNTIEISKDNHFEKLEILSIAPLVAQKILEILV